ncbi:glycosyltransferase [Bacteroides sp. An19]|uniref:glycosyltransferase n=1 Tax=Bacteroides sp. An19 TaxID=1965580 RepID=UPI000B3705AC|nr:glycosyltransferase [Bacteroides sp. An19]OUP34133.1 hypothetical protein B5F25_06345 [Bacteroides sp. An19]
MITFIVCSISPQRAMALYNNIYDTIGDTQYRFMPFDNQTLNYGIAHVYNLCAQQAKTEYLCFLHEDVAFRCKNWGETIINKLKEPDCGIIGFTGSPVKFQAISSVHPSAKWMVNHYIQRTKEGKELFMNSFTSNAKYAPCITIDGMCMFVRRQVWQECPFDERLLPGFHGYDLDFSLQVARHYQNYICGAVTIEHFSIGSFSTEWVATTIRLHNEKWNPYLPLYIHSLSRKEVVQDEHDAFYRFIKKALRTNYPYRETYKLIKQYWRMTSFRKHSLTLLLKLIGTRFLHLNI